MEWNRKLKGLWGFLQLFAAYKMVITKQYETYSTVTKSETNRLIFVVIVLDGGSVPNSVGRRKVWKSRGEGVAIWWVQSAHLFEIGLLNSEGYSCSPPLSLQRSWPSWVGRTLFGDKKVRPLFIPLLGWLVIVIVCYREKSNKKYW